MTAAPYLPGTMELDALREASLACRGCPLWRLGTQTVFGEGAPDARVMMVGEQPGDKEDIEGRPFVGPAGGLLDRALELAGISRREVYLTNAVKHFKWAPSGARRLHQRPTRRETLACRPWLEREIASIRPRTLVALGATAAQSLFGPDFRITASRGKLLNVGFSERVLATYHPSAILRAQSSAEREKLLDTLVADLRTAVA